MLFGGMRNISISGKGGSTICWFLFFFFSSRRRHTRFDCDWSSDVCSSDLASVLGPTDDRVPEDLLGLSDITEMTTATGGVVLGPVGRKRTPAHVMSFDLNQDRKSVV